MWSRARKFANVYAFAVLDSLAVILWLSAWASTASYVASGKGKGDKTDATGCDNFKYGSPGRCKLSTGITILGVMIMLAFCSTAFFSFRAVMQFKRTGFMPNQQIGKSDFVQTQDDFSSNMHEFDDGDQHHDARQGGSYAYQQGAQDDAYAPIGQNDHDVMNQAPHQPISPLGQHGLGLGAGRFDQNDTGYHGATIAPDHDPRWQQGGQYGR
jgi:translocation protein SEC72